MCILLVLTYVYHKERFKKRKMGKILLVVVVGKWSTCVCLHGLWVHATLSVYILSRAALAIDWK